MKRVLFISVMIVLAALAGCQKADTSDAKQETVEARLFDGVDRYHRPTSSSSEEAQRWFDQGMQLLYGFNHDEAIRSFEKAAALDPEFALPWWGIAYSHGININDPEMTEERWKAAQAAVDEAIAQVPEDWWIFNNKVYQVLPIAQAMLSGELDFREGKLDEAFATLREGIAAEDALVYDEPPGWMLPVRHSLGALLMDANRYAEAEEVYREDQRRNPGNGWSLLGLIQALDMQGRIKEAKALAPGLRSAFARADVKPTSSCFCAPGKA